MIVNLISDTITIPSEGMLEAMFSAPVGDDVFKEDPSVNTFESQVAALFGKEAALFFPSGTMTNQTAIKIHTQPGDQLICDHYAHIYNYEGGGVSFNSGVSCKMIQGDRGKISASQIKPCINPSDFYHSPRTSLVCLENTTNKGGGAVYNINEIKKPELDAKLVAASITQQLERRVMYRRAMKRAVTNTMRLGANGIKVRVSGRLNGAEIARTEWYQEGRVPLHTLKANIDYGVSEALTTYGIIGVKVWIFHDEDSK